MARGGEAVEVAPDVDVSMAARRAAVEQAMAVPPDQAEQVQNALVQSYAAGMGADVDAEVVRAMQLLKAHTLATSAGQIACVRERVPRMDVDRFLAAVPEPLQ